MRWLWVSEQTYASISFMSESAFEKGAFFQVENFQPLYIFNQSHHKELRIGAAVLQEALVHEAEKEERVQRLQKEEKGIKQLQAQQACFVSSLLYLIGKFQC